MNTEDLKRNIVTAKDPRLQQAIINQIPANEMPVTTSLVELGDKLEAKTEAQRKSFNKAPSKAVLEHMQKEVDVKKAIVEQTIAADSSDIIRTTYAKILRIEHFLTANEGKPNVNPFLWRKINKWDKLLKQVAAGDEASIQIVMMMEEEPDISSEAVSPGILEVEPLSVQQLINRR